MAPGIRRSSLKTRMAPKLSFSGSRYVSNEKCQRARNHPPSMSYISLSRRTLIIFDALPCSPAGSLLVALYGSGVGGCERVQGLHQTLAKRGVAEASPSIDPERSRAIPGARVFRQPTRSAPGCGARALRQPAFRFVAGSVRRPSLAPLRLFAGDSN